MSRDPRYRHWIQEVGEGQWPTNVVCVDCESLAYVDPAHPQQSRERLTSWHLQQVLRIRERYIVSEVFHGTDAPFLLQQLRDIADRCINTWVVSYQCCRTWAMLGVWSAIEEGRIRVVDTDYRNSQAFRERVRAYRLQLSNPLRQLSGSELHNMAPKDSGYLVLEDPPTIMRCRLAGSEKPLTWLDVRNFGVEIPPEATPGESAVKWISTLMARMLHLCKIEGLTSLKPTAGSQAMSAWRHSHLTEKVYVHTDERATNIERASYCGGRCEAGSIGAVGSLCRHVDFRSQYGWVCATCTLPCRLVGYDYRPGATRPTAVRDYSCCIADVTLATDEPAYPYKRDMEVIYPCGRFRTTLCGPELCDAIQHKRVEYIHAIAEYEMGFALRSYADSLYRLRCDEEANGVPGSATWVKRLLVSLPGKLGQRQHRWVDCPGVIPSVMYGEWYGEGEGDDVVRYRSIGGIVQRDCSDGYAADSVPALAAFVTSYGRMRLMGAIRSAGMANVHYYDTDSLIVSAKGYDRLKESEYMRHDGMGYLTLRGTHKSVEIRGVKYYVEDGKVTCSGMARGHTEDDGDGVHYTRYLSPIEQARKGERPDSVVIKGTYARAEVYRHGIVGSDGRVQPFFINEARAEE